MARRCSLIGVFILCAVLLTSAVPCRAAGWSCTEFALPAIEGAAFWPKVSGNWAVALMNTSTNNANSTIGVVYYDLANRQVYSVYAGKAAEHCISGNTIAWSGKIDNIPVLRGMCGTRGTWPSCLTLYDVSSGTYVAPKLKTNSAFVISISGNQVAYELGCRINLYNIATGAQRRISDNQPLHRSPDIGGDLVVWQQYEDRTFKKSSVMCYRISTGQTFQVPDSAPSNSRAYTDGNTIVWSTTTGANVYDVKTRATRFIQGAQFPDVSNGMVVYLKGSASGCGCSGSTTAGRGVYGTDLSSKGEFRISKGTADRPPSIDNRRVVWARGGVVYCADITKVSGTGVGTGVPRGIPVPRVGKQPN